MRGACARRVRAWRRRRRFSLGLSSYVLVEAKKSGFPLSVPCRLKIESFSAFGFTGSTTSSVAVVSRRYRSVAVGGWSLHLRTKKRAQR